MPTRCLTRLFVVLIAASPTSGLALSTLKGVPVAFSILLVLSALLWLSVIRRVLCIILRVDAVLHV